MNGPMEALTFLAMAALLIVPWFIAGLTSWGWLFVAIVLLVGVWELWSVMHPVNGKKRTISQKFWAYSKENPKGAWTILACVTAGWLILVYHLAVKML